MHFISCEINLLLTRSEKQVLSNDTKATIFAITDAKPYAAAVTLSIQDNGNCLNNQVLREQLIRINFNQNQQ